MRSGRPCPCTCEQCLLSCPSVTLVTCPSGAIEYVDFYESFDNSGINEDWTNQDFSISKNRGIPLSGNYAYDSIIGAALSSPTVCSYFYGRIQSYNRNTTSGYIFLELDGGPSLRLEEDDVYLTLPNGSSILIDNTNRLGDMYDFTLSYKSLPEGFYYQSLEVYKKRFGSNESESGICPNIENGQTVIPLGVIPYTGCKYNSCRIFYDDYHSSGDTLYTITSPIQYNVAISGSNIQIDNVCLLAEDRARLLSPYDTVYMPSGSGCVTECSAIHYAPTITYQSPKLGGGYCLDTYSTELDLVWTATADYIIDQLVDNCDMTADPTLDGTVYLKTTVKTYDVDISSSGTFVLVPYAAKQDVPIFKNNPFDEDEPFKTSFSGVPCDWCNSPPFLKIDSDDVSRWSYFQGNATVLNNNCAQFGVLEDHITSSGDQYLYIDDGYEFIPRRDDISIARLSRDATPENNLVYNFGDNLGEIWNHDILGYSLSWDSDKWLWYGSYVPMGGSGTTVALPSGHDSKFDGVDLSIIYNNTGCEDYSLYVYGDCNGDAGSNRLEIYNEDSSIFYSGAYETYDPGYNTYAFNYNSIKFYDFYNVYNSGDCDTCVVESGFEINTSGSYDVELLSFAEYNIDTSGDYAQKLPYVFFDSLGYPILKYSPYSDYIEGSFQPAQQSYFDNSSFPMGCLSAFQHKKLYELNPDDTTTLHSSGNQYNLITGSHNCGMYTGVPFWYGKGNARIFSDGLLDSTTRYHAPDPSGRGYGDGFVDFTDSMIDFGQMYVYLFFAENDEIKAFMSPINSISSNIFPESPVEGGWLDGPNNLFKSESDFVNNTYFADVDILNTSPLRLHIWQSFMAWGEDAEGTCRLAGYTLDMVIEEPTYV